MTPFLLFAMPLLAHFLFVSNGMYEYFFFLLVVQKPILKIGNLIYRVHLFFLGEDGNGVNHNGMDSVLLHKIFSIA